MRLPLFLLCFSVAAGSTLAAQSRSATPPATPVSFSPAYRGFSPGRPYREFAERARALAQRDTLRCNTSRKTAQLMECGVTIRDPSDSARFYLSAYVLEGKIAMVSLTDSGGPPLVQWARRDLSKRFGPAHRRETLRDCRRGVCILVRTSSTPAKPGDR